jgi:hypothetical protein
MIVGPIEDASVKMRQALRQARSAGVLGCAVVCTERKGEPELATRRIAPVDLRAPSTSDVGARIAAPELTVWVRRFMEPRRSKLVGTDLRRLRRRPI